MSLFADIGKGTVDEAVKQLDPLARDIENRAGGILHGVLDRLNGAKLKIVDGGFQIEIPPLPKAEAV